MDQKILGTSTLYGHGKTNVPATIRKKLRVKDKDRLVYYEDSSGRIYINNDKIEEKTPSIYYPDQH